MFKVRQCAPQVNIYRPQRSCEGYVFTPVCQSFCSQGRSASVHVGIPPGTRHSSGSKPPRDRHTPPPPRAGTPQSRHPPGSDTPRADTPQQTATVADGTHPTGIHSSDSCVHVSNISSFCLTGFWLNCFVSGSTCSQTVLLHPAGTSVISS